MVTVCKQNSRYYPGVFVQRHFLLTLISSIKCINEPSAFFYIYFKYFIVLENIKGFDHPRLLDMANQCPNSIIIMHIIDTFSDGGTNQLTP